MRARLGRDRSNEGCATYTANQVRVRGTDVVEDERHLWDLKADCDWSDILRHAGGISFQPLEYGFQSEIGSHIYHYFINRPQNASPRIRCVSEL